MLRPLFLLTVFSTALAAASCGDDTTNTSSDATTTTSSSSSGGVTAAAACSAFSKAICSKLNSCSSVFVSLQFGDMAGCEARVGINCPSSISAPGSTMTADQWMACADAVPSATCDDIIGRNPPEACKPPPGTVADGAACGADQQCESTHCDNSSDLCGVCAKPVSAGSSCMNDGQCELGLRCAKDKCVAPVGMGETCDMATPCKATLACSGGKCATPKAAGAACDPLSQDCDTLQGLFCNKMSVCQKIKLAAAGEVCGQVSMDQVVCGSGGSCKLGAMGMGTCVAPAADGAACDTDTPCLAEARCVNSVCALSDPATCK